MAGLARNPTSRGLINQTLNNRSSLETHSSRKFESLLTSDKKRDQDSIQVRPQVNQSRNRATALKYSSSAYKRYGSLTHDPVSAHS